MELATGSQNGRRRSTELSADGTLQSRIEGFRPADQYLAELSSFVKGVEQNASILEQKVISPDLQPKCASRNDIAA
jgi:hypothetical protein